MPPCPSEEGHTGEGPRLDIWHIRAGTPVARAERILSVEEIDYARRLRKPLQRSCWIYFRVALREILSNYSGAAATALRFVTGVRGKPALAGSSELHFNLSHSADTALVAVTHAAPVGVDVEYERPLDDMESVAKQVFSQAEQSEFRSLLGAQRINYFYKIWTGKEAVIKANGAGLSIAPHTLHLGDPADTDWQLLCATGSTPPASVYRVRRLSMVKGLTAAVAIEVPAAQPFAPPFLNSRRYTPAQQSSPDYHLAQALV